MDAGVSFRNYSFDFKTYYLHYTKIIVIEYDLQIKQETAHEQSCTNK